jgi:hypothetical protein
MSVADLSNELAEFAGLGRADIYGERRAPRPPDRPKWWYCTKDGELTPELLHRHLNGGPHLGLYLLPALSDSTRIAVFDLDDHDGTIDPEKMRDAAVTLRTAAVRRGIWMWPVRSGGGCGIHLCAKWEQPQPARDVRYAMISVLAEVELRDGTGGIENGEVEVFPKQDAVEGEGIGSLIALPFGRASVPLDDEMRPVERPMPWLSAAPVAAAPPEPERMPPGDPTAPIEDVVAALAVIPNDADTDFEVYIKVGMEVAAASGGSEEGFAAWDEWARRRSDKYQKHDVRKRWDYWQQKPPSRTGFGALVKRARQHQPGWQPPSRLTTDDFWAYMPQHSYIFAPTRSHWPGSSVNARLPKVPLLREDGSSVLDDKGNPVKIAAAAWLDRHKPVEQMTWTPGLPMVIRDHLLLDGGWTGRAGITCFNLYIPPTIVPGDPAQAGMWIDHVRHIYPDEADHLFAWLAHRVQKPEEKINHAIVLGGEQGIGKDTMVEPVKEAIGRWNMQEASPAQVLEPFNGYLKSVILRISGARSGRFRPLQVLRPYESLHCIAAGRAARQRKTHPAVPDRQCLWRHHHYQPQDRRHLPASRRSPPLCRMVRTHQGRCALPERLLEENLGLLRRWRDATCHRLADAARHHRVRRQGAAAQDGGVLGDCQRKSTGRGGRACRRAR